IGGPGGVEVDVAGAAHWVERSQHRFEHGSGFLLCASTDDRTVDLVDGVILESADAEHLNERSVLEGHALADPSTEQAEQRRESPGRVKAVCVTEGARSETTRQFELGRLAAPVPEVVEQKVGDGLTHNGSHLHLGRQTVGGKGKMIGLVEGHLRKTSLKDVAVA